jgi:hypothetical protein
MFGPAAVGAADFLNECKWDMQVAVNAMLETIHRRDEIEECFTRKGTTPVSREAERVTLMSQELDKVLLRFTSLKLPKTKSAEELAAKAGGAASGAQRGLPRASSTSLIRDRSWDQLTSRGSGSAASSADECDKSGLDPMEKGARSRNYSNMSADDRMHFESLKAGHFESEAAQILRQAAAHKAQMDSEKERMRYGECTPNRHGLLPRTHSEAKMAGQKKTPSNDRVRNYSENDLRQWLAQAKGGSAHEPVTVPGRGGSEGGQGVTTDTHTHTHTHTSASLPLPAPATEPPHTHTHTHTHGLQSLIP